MIDQSQAVHRHRIGFSFAFPKKATVKLESCSAAAFSEYSDESSMEKEFSRKTRFVPSTSHLQLPPPTCELLSSEEKGNSPPPEAMCTDKATAQTEERKITSNENNTLLTSSFCQLQHYIPTCSEADTCQNLAPFEDQLPMEAVIVNEDGPVSKSNPNIIEKNPTVPNDRTSAQMTTEENITINDVTKMETRNKIDRS